MSGSAGVSPACERRPIHTRHRCRTVRAHTHARGGRTPTRAGGARQAAAARKLLRTCSRASLRAGLRTNDRRTRHRAVSAPGKLFFASAGGAHASRERRYAKVRVTHVSRSERFVTHLSLPSMQQAPSLSPIQHSLSSLRFPPVPGSQTYQDVTREGTGIQY